MRGEFFQGGALQEKVQGREEEQGLALRKGTRVSSCLYLKGGHGKAQPGDVRFQARQPIGQLICEAHVSREAG